MLGFDKKRSNLSDLESLGLIQLESALDYRQLERIKRIRRFWNFYEGFHWEEIPETDKPEITTNYCRAFSDKLVSFELGKSFTMKLGMYEDEIMTKDGRTLFKYLEDVWIDNDQYQFATEMGVMKSVTGEAWIQVRFYSPEELEDPFEEYPDGRVKVTVMNTGNIFPEFDPHDKEVLTKITIMYPIEKVVRNVWGKETKEKKVFKQVWTREEIVEYEGEEVINSYENTYKTIPFVQIKNIALPGKDYGRSDLEDIIPLNVELNMKNSDVSEIIDYHSAPTTVLFGANGKNIEKSARKMWSGLPKDARIENLRMEGDLTATNTYLEKLKMAMCEVGGVPEKALGGSQSISNTSGVALQFVNGPLIEKTNMKRSLTEDGLEKVNKLIILAGIREGLLEIPEYVNVGKGTTVDGKHVDLDADGEGDRGQKVHLRDVYYNEVTIPSTLPKDVLIEIQLIQAEMASGLESRAGALSRLGREDISNKLVEIDLDRRLHPDIYGLSEIDPEINSGFLNGEDTEMLSKEPLKNPAIKDRRKEIEKDSPIKKVGASQESKIKSPNADIR